MILPSGGISELCLTKAHYFSLTRTTCEAGMGRWFHGGRATPYHILSEREGYDMSLICRGRTILYSYVLICNASHLFQGGFCHETD